MKYIPDESLGKEPKTTTTKRQELLFMKVVFMNMNVLVLTGNTALEGDISKR